LAHLGLTLAQGALPECSVSLTVGTPTRARLSVNFR
jgi:hypothetical protein